MSEPLLTARQRKLLRDLAQRAAARARDEKLLGQTAPHAKAQAEAALATGLEAAAAQLKSGLATVAIQTEEERAAVQTRLEDELAAATQAFDAARETLMNRCEEEKDAAKSAYQETRWTLSAVLERNTAKAEEKRRSAEKRLTSILDRMVTLRKEAGVLWDEWDEYLDSATKNATGPRDKNPRLGLRKSLAALDELLADLRRKVRELVLPKILKGGRLTMAFAALGVLAIYPLGLLVGLLGGPRDNLLMQLVAGLVTSSVATLIAGMTTWAVLEFVARRQVRSLFRIYPTFCKAVDAVAGRSKQRMKGERSKS